MALRSQPYRIQWPLTSGSAENIDEMFQQLYDDLRLSAIGEGSSTGGLKLTGSKGDILYIKDTSNTIGTFAVSSSAGALVRSDGSIPGWSTTTWPNSATTGDLLFATAANAYGNLAAAAAGKVLRAAGASTAPAYSTFTIPDTFTLGSLLIATGTNILGEDNANLFWDTTTKRLGMGTTGPLYGIDLRTGTSGSLAHFAGTTTDVGGYLNHLSSISFFTLSQDASVNSAGAWTAKAATASIIGGETGQVSFWANSGLTAGAAFTPTLRGRLYPSGGASFLGTISDPGNGVFQIGGSLTLITALNEIYGGTGQTTYTQGDLLYASAANTLAKLPKNATASRYLSNQGVTNNPDWQQVNLANGVSGILPVANGGTGLASGTSGGILGFTATGTLASSVVLTANALLLGGGAGATPTVLSSLGTTTTLLHGNAVGAPTFSAASLTADVSGTLPVANGGTGLATVATDNLMTGNGTAALTAESTLTYNGTTLTLGSGQVAFPSAQNASTGVNTLDDYEEGTWTPVLTFATPGDVSVAYTAQVGRYTKIGNRVIVQYNVNTSSFTFTTASGALQLTGLPFTHITASGSGDRASVGWSGITKTNYTDMVGIIGSASALVGFEMSGSGQTNSTLVAADTPSGGTVVLSGIAVYEVAT